MLTDATINITPTLAEKRGIVQNAIDLAHVIGVALPRLAIISAAKTVSGKMPSTSNAAALCKMADRGQVRGGLPDSLQAFDNAVNLKPARDKKNVSNVAGKADIIVVPDLEAGNMLAKHSTFLTDADAAVGWSADTHSLMRCCMPHCLCSRPECSFEALADGQ
jgi:phosphate butyryltransferase